MVKIIIADSHELMREGLKHIFEKVSGVLVVGEATTGAESVHMARTIACDVFVLEPAMPDRGGVDLIRHIKCVCPHVPILVLTAHREDDYASRSIRAGASGYLTKSGPSKELIQALRKMATGRPYISQGVAEQLALELLCPTAQSGHSLLTDREQQVFTLLVNGMSVTDIAQKLHLSVKTISTHKTKIMARMNFRSYSEMIQYAVTHNLIHAHNSEIF